MPWVDERQIGEDRLLLGMTLLCLVVVTVAVWLITRTPLY